MKQTKYANAYTEIIERILIENNELLQEIINIVKDNDVFNDVMSNVKEQYFIDDAIYGISHNEREALLACYIGIKEGLNKDRSEIQQILLDNKESLQTSILPISIDLLAGRGRDVNKLKKRAYRFRYR